VLVPAAADPVLELDNVIHELMCFCFFLIWKVFAFAFVLSGRSSLADGRLCFDSNRPDESQQFASNRSNDLSLGFAGRTQPHIPLVQTVLRFPRNFLGLF